MVGGPFDEQVNVVRHIAVRKYRHVEVSGGTQELIMNAPDELLSGEMRPPLKRADGQEVLLRTGVAVVLESAGTHASARASGTPEDVPYGLAPLKGCPTAWHR